MLWVWGVCAGMPPRSVGEKINFVILRWDGFANAHVRVSTLRSFGKKRLAILGAFRTGCVGGLRHFFPRRTGEFPKRKNPRSAKEDIS